MVKKIALLLSASLLISFLQPFQTLPTLTSSLQAQVKLTQDTMSTPLIGFSFGTMMTSSNHSTTNGLHDLYDSPFLNFGLDATYKFKSNWVAGIDGNLIFGNDNLTHREERMPSVFSHDVAPIVIGTNGTDANVSCYNRELSFRIGGGKIFTLGDRNPNSGIVLRLYGGIMQHKTIFMINDVNAPQLQGDYAKLYDHKRRGFTLTESIGFWYMSNHANFTNLYIAFEVTQFWNHSTRDYMIDNYIGLHGPDNTNYFDLLYSVKLCWMIPLRGKTAYDYYFY